MSHVLMVAAENDALAPVEVDGRLMTAKVGGIGDVVRDAPRALAERGVEVTVVTPAYGAFDRGPGAREIGSITAPFGRGSAEVSVVEAAPRDAVPGVRNLVLGHHRFATGGAGRVYLDDPPTRPFASDATKFALFCSAVAMGVERGAFGSVDAVHLHDWHAAMVLVLRRYHPGLGRLRALRCVYTVHNLALQGLRPFTGDESSLDAWYPGLPYEYERLADPRWRFCINPMAAAVRLADCVHTVSPTYAREILRPTRPGVPGGDGLEADLAAAAREGRLSGILNGANYPERAPGDKATWPGLVRSAAESVEDWIVANGRVSHSHALAGYRLAGLGRRAGRMVLTSVGRLTGQKVGLLGARLPDGRPVLDAVLDHLGDRGLLVVLGSGDAGHEQNLLDAATRYSNFLYLRGYSDALANALYRSGDLFFMPSSFEPCGISQMLAMRAGQPCLVHAVGGLRDTVFEGENGFTFEGPDPGAQGVALLDALGRACNMFHERPTEWRALRRRAAACRFGWSESVREYLETLYGLPDPGAPA